MAEVLVLVEHAAGAPTKVTAELLGAATILGQPAAVVVGGPGLTETLAEQLTTAGADKIYAAESEAADNFLVTPKVDVLAGLVESASPAAVLVAASAEGKEVAGRLAARIGSGLLVDATAVHPDGSVEHSIFGGAITVEAKATGDVPVISVRPGAMEPATTAGAGQRVSVEVPAQEEGVVQVVSREPAVAGDRPGLAEANIVVSGGRGVGSADNFQVVEALADSLGAAVGASRAAVDSGYYPGQFQVGQTGKTVSPQLYIALGISGAIQHRAGMQTSKTIVAVNKDPEAPIFEIADYGVVGDLFQVAPQLTEAVTQHKS